MIYITPAAIVAQPRSGGDIAASDHDDQRELES